LCVAHGCASLPNVDDALIYREEVAALLFNVSDMAASLEAIEALLGGDDEPEEEADRG
jgi:hypothetical protein